LPQTAATWRKESSEHWSHDQEVAASTVEAIDFWGRQQSMFLWRLGARKGDKAPQWHEQLRIDHPARPTRRVRKVHITEALGQIGKG